MKKVLTFLVIFISVYSGYADDNLPIYLHIRQFCDLNKNNCTNFWLRSVDSQGNPAYSNMYETQICKEPGNTNTPWAYHIGLNNQTNSVFDDKEQYYSFTGSTIIKVGNASFSQNNKLTGITMNPSVIYLGNSAFFSCISLATVSCSPNLLSIGNECFRYDNALTTVDLAGAHTTIGNRAFENTILSGFLNYSNITSVGDYAFANCSGLESIHRYI